MKAALVVGIDSYDDPSIPALHFCRSDAEELAALLAEPEYGFDVEILCDAQATQRNIRISSHRIRQRNPELFLFFFAGHGEIIRDRGYLITTDGVEGDYGIDLSNLSELLQLAGSPSVAILDCCHAGGAVPWWGRQAKDNSTLFRTAHLTSTEALIAACRFDQLAKESVGFRHGYLTKFLLDALTGSAANDQGEVTLLGLYEHIAQGFSDDPSQEPVLKAQLDGQLVLGSGLTPGLVASSSESTRQVLASAQGRAERLHELMGVDARIWRSGGWARAATALGDLIAWAASKEGSLPALVRVAEWQDFRSSINGYLSRLAALQEGVELPDGKVERIVGSGAFGSVYLIKNGATERALKVYNSGELNNAAKIDRFRRGFRAMERLRHPNIVRVHKFMDAPLCFLMDFVPGPNLRQIVSELGDLRERLIYFKTICQAVDFAHKNGVLHRDVKPENVVVAYDQGGNLSDAYLTDFDLAWFSTATTTLVPEGGLGTIYYAAPEQLQHPDANKSRKETVDVYSLGQLLYFLATNGRDPASTSARNAQSLDVSLRTDFDSAVGRQALVDLYRAAANENISDRIQSADELLARLDQVIIGHLIVQDDDPLDRATFVAEVAQRVMGYLGQIDLVDEGALNVRSASGRVRIIFDVARQGQNLEIVACLTPLGRLAVEGASTYAEARVALNRRLDGRADKLQDSTIRVSRRHGDKPEYEAIFQIAPVAQSRIGARVLSEIVSSLTSVVDQYCQ